MSICEICGRDVLIIYPLDIVSYIILAIFPPRTLFEIHNKKQVCKHCLDELYKNCDLNRLTGTIEIYDCSKP
jgi:hypothetical protein